MSCGRVASESPIVSVVNRSLGLAGSSLVGLVVPDTRSMSFPPMLRAEPYPWDTVSAPDRTRWFRISTPTLAPRGLDHGVGGPPRPAPPQSILRATGPPPRG